MAVGFQPRLGDKREAAAAPVVDDNQEGEDRSQGSYRTILRATSIVGGAQVFSIVFGIVRTKALALLLGPGGVGLAAMYQAVADLVATVTGLGIGSAGVRQVADATATNDSTRVGRTAATLGLLAPISGAFGMVILLALARPLARWTFNSEGYAWGVALMSLTLLFAATATGQNAVLQGLRRLRDLATCQVMGSLFGTVASIMLVYVLRERGIVPSLVATSLFSAFASWWFAQRVPLERARLTRSELWSEARPLLALGSAFVVSGLCAAGMAWLIRALVLRKLGIEAVGLYTATSTLSTVYVGIVLGAMGADFYPRLTSVAQNNAAMNRLVNEQTEMGILVALPGLLATLVLAPWVLKIFYTAEFIAGTDVIRWQVLGVGLRVVAFPMGFVQLAQGRARLFMATEIIFAALQVLLAFAGVSWLGLIGCGVSLFVVYAVYTVVMFGVCRRLSGFSWSRPALGLIALSVVSSSAVLVLLSADPLRGGKVGAAGLAIVCALGSAYILRRKVAPDFEIVWRQVARAMRPRCGGRRR